MRGRRAPRRLRGQWPDSHARPKGVSSPRGPHAQRQFTARPGRAWATPPLCKHCSRVSLFSWGAASKPERTLLRPLAAAWDLGDPESRRDPRAASLVARLIPRTPSPVPSFTSPRLIRQGGDGRASLPAGAEDVATSATPVNKIFICKDAGHPPFLSCIKILTLNSSGFCLMLTSTIYKEKKKAPRCLGRR